MPEKTLPAAESVRFHHWMHGFGHEIHGFGDQDFDSTSNGIGTEPMGEIGKEAG